MKNVRFSIPLRIKKASGVLMCLLCLTAFLIMGSVSSVKAQACPSFYHIYPDGSGSGFYSTGSDLDVYYQIYRNGYVWDVYREGTGDFMYWENLCSGEYTVVTWKPGCAPVTLTNLGGQPVVINSWDCGISFSSVVPVIEVNSEVYSPHCYEVKKNYAWFVNNKNTGNWLSKS